MDINKKYDIQNNEIIMPATLRITETFESLDGEVSPFHQGRISVFIRMAGCQLACVWCDSAYAQKTSETDRIIESAYQIDKFINFLLSKYTSKKYTITGGEPLMQEEGVNYLVQGLRKQGMLITIETNGSIKPNYKIDCPEVSYIVDYKLPSSGMEKHMNPWWWEGGLSNRDVLKMVIGSYDDYKRARQLIRETFSVLPCIIALQPILATIDTRLLLEWMIRDKLTSPIISIQIQKILHLK